MIKADILRAIELLNLAEVAYDNPNIVGGNAQAFHHEYDTYQILAVAGTNSVLDALQDAAAFPVHRDWAGDVHQGVIHHLEEILPAIIQRLVPGKPVELVGHSLGGGVVQVLALRLLLAGFSVSRVTTFGGLRVGLSSWVDKYEQANIPTIRWINGCDPVPHAPPCPVFYHAGPGVGLVNGILEPNVEPPIAPIEDLIHHHHPVEKYREQFTIVLGRMT